MIVIYLILQYHLCRELFPKEMQRKKQFNKWDSLVIKLFINAPSAAVSSLNELIIVVCVKDAFEKWIIIAPGLITVSGKWIKNTSFYLQYGFKQFHLLLMPIYAFEFLNLISLMVGVFKKCICSLFINNWHNLLFLSVWIKLK